MKIYAKSCSRMEEGKFPLAGEVSLTKQRMALEEGTLKLNLKDLGGSLPDRLYGQSTHHGKEESPM